MPQNLVDLNVDARSITTTSKIVADYFGKEHRYVIGVIDKMIDEGGSVYFTASNYTSSQNKTNPCYLMGRDGFSLLAMSFTGKTAIAWKINFIQAFNKMEETLQQIDNMNLSKSVENEEVKLQLEQIEMKRERMKVEHALELARMCGVSFDINNYFDGSTCAIPADELLKLKMAMGKQIAEFGSLSLPHSAVSALLDDSGVDILPTTFNQSLVKAGILTEDRKVTDLGLHFGFNMSGGKNRITKQNNPTQPRWFDDRFKELLGYLASSNLLDTNTKK